VLLAKGGMDRLGGAWTCVRIVAYPEAAAPPAFRRQSD